MGRKNAPGPESESRRDDVARVSSVAVAEIIHAVLVHANWHLSVLVSHPRPVRTKERIMKV